MGVTMSAQPPRKSQKWIVAGVFGFLLLLAAFGTSGGNKDATASKSVNSMTRSERVQVVAPITSSESGPSTGIEGSGVSRVDQTLAPIERENYARDRSSHGFSDEDRDFLREHGVSESEARAVETVTREAGVE